MTTENEKKLAKPPVLRKVCSISCSMSARDFFDLLEKEEVKAVLDTRVNRDYRGKGFQTAEDDFRLLCELKEIKYHVVNGFMPTQEMRQVFASTFKDLKKSADRDPMAWTNFLESYERLLKERRPFHTSAFMNIINGDFKAIAVVCACRHHDDCHRSFASGLLANLLPEVELRILYPKNKPPPRASPRRYRLRDFPWAKLKAEKPRGGR